MTTRAEVLTNAQHGWVPYYWERFGAGELPPGEHLAAIRRGINRPAGGDPGLWPHYTRLEEDGRLTRWLVAEHCALTLFAIHQQSRSTLMHRAGVGVGTAVRALRESGRFSSEAVDRRFTATATAESVSELAFHLRGLVTQLRGMEQPLDYTRLTRDLHNWQDPDGRPTVRRRWGGQYFTRPQVAAATPS